MKTSNFLSIPHLSSPSLLKKESLEILVCRFSLIEDLAVFM
ncbi:hypothetical protein AtNW77_Chr5g0141461 [Arabidopsis thaliana]